MTTAKFRADNGIVDPPQLDLLKKNRYARGAFRARGKACPRLANTAANMSDGYAMTFECVEHPWNGACIIFDDG